MDPGSGPPSSLSRGAGPSFPGFVSGEGVREGSGVDVVTLVLIILWSECLLSK